MYTGCSLMVGDDTVSPPDRIKNLGVYMDQYLSMTDHVTAVCVTCNYHLNRLSSIQHYLTTEAAKRSVTALVPSRLYYCNSLLHKHTVITDSSATACTDQCSQAKNTHQ